MTAPFQHSIIAHDRFKASGYVDAHLRKDCCARCLNSVMRGRNPYCNLHRVFVQKMGTCASNTNLGVEVAKFERKAASGAVATWIGVLKP